MCVRVCSLLVYIEFILKLPISEHSSETSYIDSQPPPLMSSLSQDFEVEERFDYNLGKASEADTENMNT